MGHRPRNIAAGERDRMTGHRARFSVFRILFASIIFIVPLSIQQVFADITLTQAGGETLVLQVTGQTNHYTGAKPGGTGICSGRG